MSVVGQRVGSSIWLQMVNYPRYYKAQSAGFQLQWSNSELVDFLRPELQWIAPRLAVALIPNAKSRFYIWCCLLSYSMLDRRRIIEWNRDHTREL